MEYVIIPTPQVYGLPETAFNKANKEENHQSAIDGYLEAEDFFEKAAKEAEKARLEKEEKLKQETIPSPESAAQLELAEIDSVRKKIIDAGIHEYAPEEWENAEEAYRAAKNSPDEQAIMRAKTRYIDFATMADNNHNNYVRLTTGWARITASVLKYVPVRHEMQRKWMLLIETAGCQFG